jgi:hypothetical protein
MLNGKFHGRRPVGRPRLRWEENTRRASLLLLNVRGRRKLAGDRDIGPGCRAVKEKEEEEEEEEEEVTLLYATNYSK